MTGLDGRSCQPSLERGHATRAEIGCRPLPFPVTFAAHDVQQPRLGIDRGLDVIDCDSHQFAGPEPGVIGHGKQRLVPEPGQRRIAAVQRGANVDAAGTIRERILDATAEPQRPRLRLSDTDIAPKRGHRQLDELVLTGINHAAQTMELGDRCTIAGERSGGSPLPCPMLEERGERLRRCWQRFAALHPAPGIECGDVGAKGAQRVGRRGRGVGLQQCAIDEHAGGPRQHCEITGKLDVIVGNDVGGHGGSPVVCGHFPAKLPGMR